LFEKTSSPSFLRAAFPFALAAIFVKVYSYTDAILISKYLGTEAVGMYSVAYKYTYAFQFLPLAFVAALYPGFSELVAKDISALRQLFEQAMRYMALLATPIVFGLWSIASSVVLLAGEAYEEAGPVLAILVFALLPIFLDYPIGSLLNAAYHQTAKTVIMGLTMIMNVTFNFWLIPFMGVSGAAVSALISFTFMLACGLWFVPKIIPGYSLWSLGKICVPIFFCGGVMAASARFLLFRFGS
jgi:O-antigen/teichoic acid export membrane protein